MLFVLSCTAYKKTPTGKPYVAENSIELRGGKFSRTERQAVIQRLQNQLDDSSKVTVKDQFLISHVIKKPVAFDTGYAAISAMNMQTSMYHLGYYHAKGTYTTIPFRKKNFIFIPIPNTRKRKISVKYIVDAGEPTLIDTFSHSLKKQELQQIAVGGKSESQIVKDNPITKVAVLAEISRLVDSFRNNGYYKFTAAELRMRGDTSIAALTTVTSDPFEEIEILSQAQQQKDSPKIKLALVLNKPDDSTKLNKYYINKIYILSDFRGGDILSDTVNILQHNSKNFIIRYHERLFRTSLFTRNVTLRSGDVFNQSEYYKTLYNLSRLGVWQSVNIRIIENLDEVNKVDLVFELLPAKKFGPQITLEASYSATTNATSALGGNLFGIATNFSLVNRNVAKEAIRMTHNLRAGIELNNNSKSRNSLINSNEISYTNNIAIPRFILFKKKPEQKAFKSSETFLNTGFAFTNRLNLFSLQTFSLDPGQAWTTKKDHRVSARLNTEFSYLFNQSDSFKNIINQNPFLRYSYNTSFILGAAGSYSSTYHNPHHPLSLSKDRTFTANIEESGIIIGKLIPIKIAEKYKKHYVRLDAEYKYTVNKPKTAYAFRAFTGVGIPLSGDTTLPFFKQYFGGGSNSMRGWPVRGIGRGSQKLVPYAQNIFNDRTGDMQIELNGEFRHDIARLIPDLLTLKGAVFFDIGNVWNIKNSTPGMIDPAQFKFKNLYKELGMSAGYGLRFDFQYLILRTDFAFRFKRPETSDVNDGWKAPPISFSDAFGKIFAKRYRQWRYENFNFTIGINYPF